MFDIKHPSFANPPQVRLGLASDGFNSFGLRNNQQSTWPILIIPYNLPPWMCMRKPNLSLPLIIPKYPGDHMDLYLSPLINKIKELWKPRVNTFEKLIGQTFKMRAGLLCGQ